MRWPTFRSLLALLLAGLLVCPRLQAQSGGPSTVFSVDPRLTVRPDPKRAKKLAELGAKEEAAGAYAQALAAYEQAARYAPFDVTVVSKAAALRSRLVRTYVETAERLALDGRFLEATTQLAAALQVDADNTLVLERLHQMREMQADQEGLPPEPAPEGLPQAAPEKTFKSFHFQADVRGAYEQVAGAYGLKVSFDPDLPTREVKFRLKDVDFDTAMKVLAAESGTFWHPLNAKLIFVAGDTPEKRKTFEPEVEQTFALPSSVTANDLTELVRVVRETTGIQHIQQSLLAHSLTVRDTMPRVQLASALIRQLEEARGEVLLEIDLLEVDKNKATQMGITPPSQIKLYSLPPSLVNELRTAPSLSALLTILASIFGGALGTIAAGGVGSLAASIPPVAAFGGGKSTFLLTLPSVSADFSESLSLVRSGQQVLLRAQDGKPATYFLGERYPITLSLLSGSLGGANVVPNPGGTGVTIPTEQFTVGRDPVALVSADFRSIGTLDLAVLNQIDNSITILLNQGTNATSQFAQANGSPISLGTTSALAQPIVSPADTLTVTSATLTSIAITPGTSTLAVGATQNFTAMGTYSDGSTANVTSAVTWNSTSPAVATIGSSTGLATGVYGGSTQITATLGTVTSNAATVHVTSAILQSIAVTPANASIAAGTRLPFTATGTFSDGSSENITASCNWTSSNATVATITRTGGLASALTPGTTQITASLGSMSSPAVKLTVTNATLKSIAVTPPGPSIGLGATVQFTATGTFSDGTTQDITLSVRWASSNTSIATIYASTGLATAATAGTTNVTATYGGSGVPSALAVGNLEPLINSIPDLLVASQVTNDVVVLFGNGDGTFTSPSASASYPVGRQPTAVAVGAFNSTNNSYPGFVVTNFLDSTYSVYVGNGSGGFSEVGGSPFSLPATAKGPTALTVADFNGDGIPDLAIVNQTTQNVTVLEGLGNGTFREFPKSPLAVGNSPVAIASGSLTGSSGPALAIVNQADDTVSVYFGNGDGTFVAASQSPLATSTSPSGVAIANLASQAYGGIAVTNTGSGTITVFADLGNGLFTKALEPSAGTNPGAIVVGGFTNSSLPDMAVTNNISGADGLVTLLISPTSLISNPALNQQFYPGSEYADIGVKVKATPTLHSNREVTLQLEIETSSLAGTSVNGIPVIANRKLTQMVRLKVDETSLLAGLLDQEEIKSITGLPGLATLPGAGYAFGLHSDNFTEGELLILITPRAVRLPMHTARTLYAGRGDTTGRGSAGTGAPPPPPTAQPSEGQPAGAPQENPPPAAPPPSQGTPPENAPPGPPPTPPQPQPPPPKPES